MLGELKLRVVTHKIILGAIAALAGLFGLGMLNLAAFFALQVHMGPAGSALIVAVANLVFAGILVSIASKLAPGPEVKIVEEVREIALADIEAEAQAVQNELRMVRDEIMSMQASVSRLLHNPLELLAPKAIVPLIAAATQIIKNWDSSPKPAPKKPAASKRRAPAASRRKTKSS